jgi:DNA topoisomerase IA
LEALKRSPLAFGSTPQVEEALKEKGLGTPATRAAIIETLLERGYISREKKALVATDLGRYLVALVQDRGLKSPELTGEWEVDVRVELPNGEVFRQRALYRDSPSKGEARTWAEEREHHVKTLARQGLDLDLEYVARQSLPLDLWILLKTIPVVLSTHGAL